MRLHSEAIIWLLAGAAVAKRVANLNFDPKVVDEIVNAGKFEKRSPKNVVNLNFVVDDSQLDKLEKREPKNVAHLNLHIDADDLPGKKVKRFAKNVVDLDFIVDDDTLSKLSKRDVEALELAAKDGKVSVEKKNEETRLRIIQDISDSVYDIVMDIPHAIAESIQEEQRVLKLIGEKQKGYRATVVPETTTGTIAAAMNAHDDVSIFASYVRDISALYKMCDSPAEFDINGVDATENMLLVFAPTDEAMMRLSAKPWQFPQEQDGDDDIASKNIRHFAESHIARASSKAFKADKSVVLETLNGNKVFLKNTDEGFHVGLEDVDDWLPINRMEVLDNGALLTIDATLSWPGRSVN